MQSDRQAWWDCNGGGGPAGAGTWGWLRAAVVPEQLSKPFRSWLPWIWKTQLHRQEEFGPLEGEARLSKPQPLGPAAAHPRQALRHQLSKCRAVPLEQHKCRQRLALMDHTSSASVLPNATFHLGCARRFNTQTTLMQVYINTEVHIYQDRF